MHHSAAVVAVRHEVTLKKRVEVQGREWTARGEQTAAIAWLGTYVCICARARMCFVTCVCVCLFACVRE